MTALTYAMFEADARERGFDELLERHWPADKVVDTHMHAFDVQARVAAGEMWLTVGGHTRHLRPGDPFEVARDVPHAERYGPLGATLWVARRN